MENSEKRFSTTTISSAMLMAAGLGTRLKPFSERLPKPLLPVMGVPIAQFALDLLEGTSVSRIVANIHHKPELAREGLARLDRGSRELRISDESSQLLGSGGGMRKALPDLGPGAFFLLNGDVMYDVDLAALEARHAMLRRQWGVSMTLSVLERGPGSYREILVDPATGLAKGVGDARVGRPFFASVAIVESEALAHLPEGSVQDFTSAVMIPEMQRGRVGIHWIEAAPWFDMGSPESWQGAHDSLIGMLENGRAPLRWRRRIEAVSSRRNSGIWISRNARTPSSIMNWTGPAFWDGQGPAPRALGPSAALYGRAPHEEPLEKGIGLGGTWVRCPSPTGLEAWSVCGPSSRLA